jgi:hypothetical protein
VPVNPGPDASAGTPGIDIITRRETKLPQPADPNCYRPGHVDKKLITYPVFRTWKLSRLNFPAPCTRSYIKIYVTHRFILTIVHKKRPEFN